ncbi:MAG: glycosyltransferase family 4 protein [Lutibacter sp.]
MKILLVSMSSIHFFRWTKQLKDSGHEVFWFDILDNIKPSERIPWVHQIVSWKRRWDFPGRYFLKNNALIIHKNLQKINERNTAKEFEKIVLKIQPDVIHSFALYVACTPILEVMNKYPEIKWVYSSWGSDLFYFKNIPSYLKDIKKVLPRVDYLFTDCQRDLQIAQELGFNGQFLGVFPGGGGYVLEDFGSNLKHLYKRTIILIKGFQGRSGRSIPVLKAVVQLKVVLEKYEIVVFGADQEVMNVANSMHLTEWSNFKIVGRIAHKEVLQLMGKALVYFGNSNSDGIPNTLLEAICFGAFPIQSNPGGATAEIIEDGKNGFLIQNCDDIIEIRSKIEKALVNRELLINAFKMNMKLRNQLEYNYIREQVLNKYIQVENDILFQNNH